MSTEQHDDDPGRPELARDEATTEDDPGDDVTIQVQAVRVCLDGRDPYTVTVLNPDYLRWDKTAPRHGWEAAKQSFLFATFLAWAASKRTGATDLTWDQFETQCLDVTQRMERVARPTRSGPAPD